MNDELASGGSPFLSHFQKRAIAAAKFHIFIGKNLVKSRKMIYNSGENMNLTVTVTPKGIKEFPLHRHETTEIMLYLGGQGVLRTENGNIPFAAGTAAIIPAGIRHGTKSENGFDNVCIYVPVKSKPKSFTAGDEFIRLVLLTRDLYFGGKIRAAEYVAEAVMEIALSPLADADEIEEIRRSIGENFTDPSFDLNAEIEKKGYTVDHFRVIYRDRYGETPVKTLAAARLDYARKLFDCYGDAIGISDAAWRCGFDDALYFSKKFKAAFGLCPREYVQANKARPDEKP